MALYAQDAPAFGLRRMHAALASGFFDMWYTDPWMGQRYGSLPPDLNTLMLKLVDYPISLNLLFSVNLFIAALGMYVLLRTLRLNTPACMLGGIGYMLTNTVITLVYAGHVNKIMTYAWIPFSLAFYVRALRDRKLRDFAVSGAFLGLALLGGEVQIPYYLGLWYTVWLILTLARDAWMKRKISADVVKGGAGLALIMICSLGLGMSTTLHSLGYFQKNAPIAGAADSQENWQFATQFYFPPSEVLSYVTTIQYFGAPQAYWGHDGDPTPLRGSDDYMGLLPLGFAIVGAVACWRIWQARLFLVMAVGSLLASFGRAGIVYQLLYCLPTMKAQRNPHRWSYFVSLAVCVLAAYGVDWFWRRLRETRAASPAESDDAPDWAKWQKWLLVIAAFSTALCAVAGVLYFLHAGVARFWYGRLFTQETGPLFVERARLLLGSLARTGIFLYFSAASLWWLITSSRKAGVSESRLRTIWGCILLTLMLDLGVNAQRYIIFDDWRQHLGNNELLGFFKKDADVYRVKVIHPQQFGMLNDLVCNLLPFHRVQVVDPIAMSRMPADYSDFFHYCDKHFLGEDRYYDLFNIKYILSMEDLAVQNGGFKPLAKWGDIRIYKREEPMPRAWLATSARVVKDGPDAVMGAVIHPSLKLRETVVLEDAPSTPLGSEFQTAKKIPEPAKKGAHPKAEIQPAKKTRDAHFVRYEDNLLEIKTDSDVPTILVVGDKWDADWKAWVDDQPTRILKANWLMRAVELRPGTHTVRMEYRPDQTGFWISSAFIGVFILYGIGAFLWSPRPGLRPTASDL